MESDKSLRFVNKEDRMKISSLILIGISTVFIAAGCGSKQTTEIPVTGNTSIPAVEMTDTPAANLPTDIPTPVIPTITPTIPVITADVSASMINLRSGPSMLHAILGQYPKNSTVVLLAAAPGYEWLKIQTQDGRIGWMSVKHLEIKDDIHILPILPITESMMVTGKVIDAANKGIPYITVTISREGTDPTIHSEGVTDENGIFYIFSPAEYQGTWSAQVTDIDCKSPIMDPNCSYTGGFTPAGGFKTNLPQDTAIVFTYRPK
jgi:hypothetical protein